MATAALPIILITTTKTAALMPDGTNAPLAYDATSQKLVVKIANGMPWDDPEKLAAINAAGGQYVADTDEWFRGVWAAPPEDVTGAEYTTNELRRRQGLPALVREQKALTAGKESGPDPVKKQTDTAHATHSRN